jgi:hypothetical protein
LDNYGKKRFSSVRIRLGEEETLLKASGFFVVCVRKGMEGYLSLYIYIYIHTTTHKAYNSFNVHVYKETLSKEISPTT